MQLLSEHNRILRVGEGGSQEYFPGDNINITDHVISGKYWDNEINSAISAASGDIVDSAYNKTTGWVDEQGFLTAHQDVDNLPYVQNSALGYNGVLVSSISGNGLFAESSLNSFYADSAGYADNANSATYADSANFVATANFANSASSALNAEIANVAYTALTANHVEGGWEHNNDGEITAYNHSAFAGGKGDYSGISPIVVDNEARIISAQSAKLGVQEPLYFVEDTSASTVIGIHDSAFPTFEGTEDGKISAINGSALNADQVVPYSGGSNISIVDHVISVTGIVDNAYHANSADYVQMAQSAHSAEIAVSALNVASSNSATYDSLGRKIVDTYLTAHQDWTNTIQNASGNAYNSAVNWVVDQHYLTAVTGDNTPYSAGANIVINDHVISVDTAIELTDITGNRGTILDPSGLYVSDLDQSDYTEIGLDHVVSTDGSARIGWQLGNKEISVDVDSGNGDYAILHMSTADVMLEQRHPNPTPDAVYSLTGACQSAASAINMINSGDNQAYSAGQNIDITDHVVSGKDWTSEIQAASAYAASQGGLEYEGVAPIVVNNIEHKISAQSALLGVQSPLYFVEDSESATIIGFSGSTGVTGQYIPYVSESTAFRSSYMTDSGIELSGSLPSFDVICETDTATRIYSDVSFNEIKSVKFIRSSLSEPIEGVDYAWIPTNTASLNYSSFYIGQFDADNLDGNSCISIDSANIIWHNGSGPYANSAAVLNKTGVQSLFNCRDTVFANSANWGLAYSAGSNINITDRVISGKDWGSDISAASSYAYNQATANIPSVTNLAYVQNTALGTANGAVTSVSSYTIGHPQVPVSGESGIYLTKNNGTVFIGFSGATYPNSAHAVGTEVTAHSANWNSTYNVVTANSANWGDIPTKIVATSAQATGSNILYIVTGV